MKYLTSSSSTYSHKSTITIIPSLLLLTISFILIPTTIQQQS